MSRRLDAGFVAQLVADHRLGDDEAIEVMHDLVVTNREERSSCDRGTCDFPTVPFAAGHAHLRGLGAPVKDPGAATAQQAAKAGDLPLAVPAVLNALEPGLDSGNDLVDAVLRRADAIQSQCYEGQDC